MSNIINVDAINLIVPGKYKAVYYKLLYIVSAQGKKIIDDCNYACNNQGHNVFTCWNLFNAAIAAYNIGEEKKADLFIDYIDKQLDIYANNDSIEIPSDYSEHIPLVTYYVRDDGGVTIHYRIEMDDEIFEDEIDATSYRWWYGALGSILKEDLSTNSLTKTEGHLEAGNYSVTTTENKPYVVFVSRDELSFTQGGLPCSFNHIYYKYKHWYISDKLTPGVNNYYVTI